MMNKSLNKKFKITSVIAALVIIAGIVLTFVLGFNFDRSVSDYKSLTVKVDSYVSVSDMRIEKVKDITENELNKAGLKNTYDFMGENAGGNELTYVFSDNLSEDKLVALKNAVETAISNEQNKDGSELKIAEIQVTSHSENIKSFLADGFIWKMVLASALILVFEFAYIALRYKLNMGVSAVISTAISTLLTLALILVSRVPVTGSIAYVVAFALFYSILLTMLVFNTMRTNFKSDEFKDVSAEDAVARSIPTRLIVTFGIVGAVSLILVGAIAVANVRWFAVASLLALISVTITTLFILPGIYLPMKRIADKKAKERARYDYKKGDNKKSADTDKKEEKVAE